MPIWLTPYHEEERKERHQAQREEIERAVARDSFLDGSQAGAEAAADRIPQHEAGDQKRERRADRARERHRDRPGNHPEQRSTRERQHGGAGQRERGHRNVGCHVAAERRDGMRVLPRLQRLAVRLQSFEAEEAAEVEDEERADQEHDEDQQRDARPLARLARGSGGGRVGAHAVPACWLMSPRFLAAPLA
jgi:hypothetical protein